MLFDRERPHAFREIRVTPGRAASVAAAERDAAVRRGARSAACQAWAVHVATDGSRVVAVEAWHDVRAFRRDTDADRSGAALFAWVGTGGLEPTPVSDAKAGAIVIDLFSVWRPLAGPVSAFNVRNGEAFNRQPGCVSTTVLRGLTAGRIATYARWRSEADFLAAFTTIMGTPVGSLGDINRAAARKTLGMIRPDYHAYELFATGGDA